jgi:hypothetical protein
VRGVYRNDEFPSFELYQSVPARRRKYGRASVRLVDFAESDSWDLWGGPDIEELF